MNKNSNAKWGRWGNFSKEGTIIRFLSNTTFPSVDGCIIWGGAVGSHGRYGSVRAMGKSWLAHRLAWTLFRGEIPKGMFVLHRCDVGLCVNCDHLFLGTQRDNVLDMEGKQRSVHPHGEQSGACKLSIEKAREAIQCHRDGETQTSIAGRFNVTVGAICHIINGRSWKRDITSA